MEKGNRFSNPSLFLSNWNWGKKLTYGKKNLDRIFILRNSILEKISCIEGDEITFPGG